MYNSRCLGDIFYSCIEAHVLVLQVVQFIQSPEYSKFTRIVFDTAPTVSTET
jgi:anion-transporting  ArsA/GET3 family ATPase